jgi:hypothetical protein
MCGRLTSVSLVAAITPLIMSSLSVAHGKSRSTPSAIPTACHEREAPDYSHTLAALTRSTSTMIPSSRDHVIIRDSFYGRRCQGQ